MCDLARTSGLIEKSQYFEYSHKFNNHLNTLISQVNCRSELKLFMSI